MNGKDWIFLKRNWRVEKVWLDMSEICPNVYLDVNKFSKKFDPLASLIRSAIHLAQFLKILIWEKFKDIFIFFAQVMTEMVFFNFGSIFMLPLMLQSFQV